jgi:hypothetical protein
MATLMIIRLDNKRLYIIWTNDIVAKLREFSAKREIIMAIIAKNNADINDAYDLIAGLRAKYGAENVINCAYPQLHTDVGDALMLKARL